MASIDLKRMAAEAALAFVPEGEVIGVGTGSTTNHFIELLASRFAGRIAGAVPSSEATAERLRRAGIPICPLPDEQALALYVDGADEFDPRLNLLKGGGGALTREKILATAARTFVCIVDESKQVDVLGRFPLPLEIIAMAEPLVCQMVRGIGGTPHRRPDFLTDNGHPIIDVTGLTVTNPHAVERELDAFPGVVSSGLFARRRATVVLMGTPDGVRRIERSGPSTP